MTAPYGSWKSPVTAQLAASAATRINGIVTDEDDIYWAEQRPAERGRTALVRRQADGRIDGDVLGDEFSVRTRMHEYGGGAFTVADGAIYFCNDSDQQIYCKPPDGKPFPSLVIARRVARDQAGMSYGMSGDNKKARQRVWRLSIVAIAG